MLYNPVINLKTSMTLSSYINDNFLGKVTNWQPFVKQAETLLKNKTEVSETEYVWSLKVVLTQARQKFRFQVLVSTSGSREDWTLFNFLAKNT